MKRQKIWSLKKLEGIKEEVVDLSIKHNHNFYVSNGKSSFILSHNSDMPDIDMDFDKDRREEIFEYLRKKYKNIIQVGTTQNFGVKNILRDCARVMEYSKEKIMVVDKICKGLSNFADTTELKKFLENNQSIVDELPEIKSLEHYVKKLLGSIRSIGCHASGICVLDKPVEEVIPINRTDNVVVSAYTEGDDRELSELGVIKIDVLGLKTVSVINSTLNLIEKTKGKEEKEKVEHSLYKFDWLDNPKLVKEFKTDNSGIFQFDSDSLWNFMKGLDPLNFRHLIDTTSLFRPDILMSGQANAYINRKSGKEIPPAYMRKNESIKEICGDTYYTFVYQEQIMFLLNRIFGFSMAEANIARKYISKKKKPELVKMLNEKLGNMSNSNILEEKEELRELVDMMYSFGGYSFNFSHAVAYTLISAQCAYLKMNYRPEFFTSLLNYSVGDEEKVIKVFNSAEKFGIKILPIDINKSQWDFSIEENDKLRAGFCLIKGLSARSFNEIEKARNSKTEKKFASINDFLFSNIDWGFLNNKIMESLIGLGAFNEIEQNSNKVMKMYDDFISKYKKRKIDMTESFFEDKKNVNDLFNASNINVQDFETKEKLAFEEKYLGFNYWISLFNSHRPYINKLKAKNILTTLEDKKKGKYVFGYLNKIKKVVSKKGKTFFFAELIDVVNKKEEIMIGADKIADQGIIEKDYYLVDFSSYIDRNGDEKYTIKEMRRPSKE